MATLLHLDASLFPGEASVSREVAASFRKAWEEQHPDGTVVHRDLAANPLPHLDAAAFTSGLTPPAEHTPEQAAAYALRDELATELERADAVLIGAPMYNYTIPSTLKSWIDQVALNGRTMGPEATTAGKPAVVVASRGGGYGPGTPRESFEFVQNYLAKALGEAILRLDVTFVVPELTLAPSTPGMEGLIELSKASRAKAHQEAERHGKELAARFLRAA